MRPAALKKGDRVALLSLASPPRSQELIASSVAAVGRLGYHVELAPHVAPGSTFLAGSDRDRASDFHWAVAQQSIRGIFCLRGGYGSMRLLPHVDWDLVATHPKVLVGMSDITALQVALLERISLVTFAGPMPLLSATGMFSRYSAERLVAAVGGDDGQGPIICQGPNDPEPIVIAAGRAQGRILGGNLQTVVSLIGTPYEPKLDGSILLLEDVGEAPYRIDRLLTQLLFAGRLRGVKGVALGRFARCYESSEEEIIAVAAERLENIGIPVLYGLALGHQDDVATWPQGCMAELDCGARELRVLERGVMPH